MSVAQTISREGFKLAVPDITGLSIGDANKAIRAAVAVLPAGTKSEIAREATLEVLRSAREQTGGATYVSAAHLQLVTVPGAHRGPGFSPAVARVA